MQSRLKGQLIKNYGVRPDIHYFDGDMDAVRTYFDYRRTNRLDTFLVDDITWNDLDGDDIFKRINHGLSTSGEQYLYYLLRSPTIERGEYEKRQKLIELMEQNSDLRLRLQEIFSRLGRRRGVNINKVFSNSPHSAKKMLLYIILAVALIGSAVSLVFSAAALPLLICLVFLNPIYHELVRKNIENDLITVHYSVAMALSAKKIQKLAAPELKQYLSPFYELVRKVKPIIHIGIVPARGTSGEIIELLSSFFLYDLIIYEFLKNRLAKHHKDIFHIHEYLGHIDSAIAIASYRKSLDNFSVPQIDFSENCGRFYATELVHPLIDIENAVPNDLDTVKPILLTGSNASGKSTFVKAIAINAILAQSICTVHCSQYSASAFRIYTSMTVTDNLLEGESYFISEIKSLKRMIDANSSKQPLLCVIDEILRGTNTVERIAASSELLKYLASKNTLCLAATHDVELCSLLKNCYRLMHFEETITEDGEILFDYTIKDGPATTRNAIKLLNLMGFDRDLINRANEKANRYTIDGKWV